MNTLACHTRNFSNSTGGAAAVEFVLIAPLLLWFCFTVIYFAMYLGIAHSVQQLAADAARASIAGLDADEQVQLSNNFVRNSAPSYLFIEPDKITVAAGPSSADPTTFDVRVRYDARDFLGWYPAAFMPAVTPQIERFAAVPSGGW